MVSASHQNIVAGRIKAFDRRILGILRAGGDGRGNLIGVYRAGGRINESLFVNSYVVVFGRNKGLHLTLLFLGKHRFPDVVDHVVANLLCSDESAELSVSVEKKNTHINTLCNHENIFRLVDCKLLGAINIVAVHKAFELTVFHINGAVIGLYEFSAGSKTHDTLILGIGHINGVVGCYGHTFGMVKGIFFSIVVKGGYNKLDRVIGIEHHKTSYFCVCVFNHVGCAFIGSAVRNLARNYLSRGNSGHIISGINNVHVSAAVDLDVLRLGEISHAEIVTGKGAARNIGVGGDYGVSVIVIHICVVCHR